MKRAFPSGRQTLGRSKAGLGKANTSRGMVLAGLTQPLSEVTTRDTSYRLKTENVCETTPPIVALMRGVASPKFHAHLASLPTAVVAVLVKLMGFFSQLRVDMVKFAVGKGHTVMLLEAESLQTLADEL